MKRLSPFLILVPLLISAMSCGVIKYTELKNKYPVSKPIPVSNKEETLIKIKAFIQQKGYYQLTDYSFRINQTPNKWEEEIKPDAYVVIRKFKDVSGNRLMKPVELVSVWTAEFTETTVAIRLTKMEASYRDPDKTTDINPGYSLGILEQEIERVIK